MDASHTSRLQSFYEQMALIRLTEEALLALFSEGYLRGTVHTCLGQEATAVGVMSALDKSRDIVCSNHRGHGHFLAYCEDVRGLVAEIMGLPSGICGGVGGSQHIHVKNFYTNGVLGGMPPVATGMAFAEKLKGNKIVSVVFLGDGAMAEGTLYEAMNLAALWKLPVLFVVEHNGYAQTTHWSVQHAGDLANRAPTFGVPVTDIDGNDVLQVAESAARLVHEIRETNEPKMLFLRTYRLGPHSKGDDLRDQQEIAFQRTQAPLARARKQLDADWCEKTDKRIADMVASLVIELKTEIA
ncbi:MAG TPA: thiamine pyrophosphate-dependent dehydrogenase E1 component subunit alpha [Noviherbaspirillum sp.]|nr:thiamine pyrophosphate-dependent dehydrogenase E1 component subunit alpha [Noviherbaspirillum sp.]